jgi:hypothetical protein
LHCYMAKSCLSGTYIYHLKVFSPGHASTGVSNTLRSIDGVFSYYGTHIKVYRYWPFGVVDLCSANKLSSVGEALDI